MKEVNVWQPNQPDALFIEDYIQGVDNADLLRRDY